MAIKISNTTVIDDSRNLTNIRNANAVGVSTFAASSTVLIGSGTSTGTASQALQVTGGAYVSGVGASVGIGTTNPTSKLDVRGDALIGNRASYFSPPGDLINFIDNENNITFPGASYEIVTVGCTTDVAGSLNNKYFTIYGPVGFNTAASGIVTSIDTTLTEQNVVVWFNVAGAGSTPSVVGAGRSVGIAITTGASNISIGNTIVTTMSSMVVLEVTLLTGSLAMTPSMGVLAMTPSMAAQISILLISPLSPLE